MKCASPRGGGPTAKKYFRKAPWLGHPPKPYWRHRSAGTTRAPQPLV